MVRVKVKQRHAVGWFFIEFCLVFSGFRIQKGKFARQSR